MGSLRNSEKMTVELNSGVLHSRHSSVQYIICTRENLIINFPLYHMTDSFEWIFIFSTNVCP